MAWGELEQDECVNELEKYGYLVTTDGEEAKEWLEGEGYLVFRDDDEAVDFACVSFRSKTLKGYGVDELVAEIERRGYLVRTEEFRR